jgi:hypothetical protein
LRYRIELAVAFLAMVLQSAYAPGVETKSNLEEFKDIGIPFHPGAESHWAEQVALPDLQAATGSKSQKRIARPRQQPSPSGRTSVERWLVMMRAALCRGISR